MKLSRIRNLNKINSQNYTRRHLAEDLNNVLGHHDLKQLCTGYTWSRVINGVLSKSLLDHVYESNDGIVKQLNQIELAYGDHKMLTLTTSGPEKTKIKKN